MEPKLASGERSSSQLARNCCAQNSCSASYFCPVHLSLRIASRFPFRELAPDLEHLGIGVNPDSTPADVNQVSLGEGTFFGFH